MDDERPIAKMLVDHIDRQLGELPDAVANWSRYSQPYSYRLWFPPFLLRVVVHVLAGFCCP
jgi:hypothetical protein